MTDAGRDLAEGLSQQSGSPDHDRPLRPEEEAEMARAGGVPVGEALQGDGPGLCRPLRVGLPADAAVSPTSLPPHSPTRPPWPCPSPRSGCTGSGRRPHPVDRASGQPVFQVRRTARRHVMSLRPGFPDAQRIDELADGHGFRSTAGHR